jgi:hypothetical protein
MSHFKPTVVLLAGLSAGASTAIADQPSSGVDVAQMEAAIAAFGVPTAQSSKAAAAAAEEIAQKQREADGKSGSTVSLIPDDLLDISPY